MKPVPGTIYNVDNFNSKIIGNNRNDFIGYKLFAKKIINNKEYLLFREVPNGIVWAQSADLIHDYFKNNFRGKKLKLSQEQAEQIYIASHQKAFSERELAKMFNISRAMVRNIRDGFSWKLK